MPENEEKFCLKHYEHKSLIETNRDDIKTLKNKLWWYNTLAIGTLIGIVINFLKDMVFK